jgi:hypothetical protein
MKGEIIPDNDNIARFCLPSKIDNGQIQATAFMLRQNEESLSVNWLESLKCSNRESEITQIREIYSKRFTVKPLAKITVLNVGKVRKEVRKKSPDGRNLEVLHEPLEDDPSHSGIYNLKPDNELIAELILETIQDTDIYPARQ